MCTHHNLNAVFKLVRTYIGVYIYEVLCYGYIMIIAQEYNIKRFPYIDICERANSLIMLNRKCKSNMYTYVYTIVGTYIRQMHTRADLYH